MGQVEYGYIEGIGEIEMFIMDSELMSQPGQCDSYVAECLPFYINQFRQFSNADLLEAVYEYGTESYSEASSREDLISFLIWVVAGDIQDNREV